MSAVIDGYDAAFFDLDGVLYLGPVAVDGAVEGIHELHARGVRTVYVTNNAARSSATVAEHLAQLGFEAVTEDVVSSAQAAGVLLARTLPAGSKVLVAGTANLVAHVEEAGMQPVFRADDEPEAVIQGYDPEMSWPRIDQAALAVQRGARWFATNMDTTRPTNRGLVPGAGMMVAAVRATTTRDPEVIGKPHRPLMEEAMRRSGAQRPLFVGDRIDTDIMGAHTVGIESFLVFTGAHGVRDLCAAPPHGRPSAIGWNVLSLFEPRREAQFDGETATCRDSVVRSVGGVAAIEGPLDTREAQLDAAWALAQLAWSASVSRYDEAAARLDLLP